MLNYRYIGLFFAIVIWSFVLLYIKPKRTRALLPVGILTASVLFLGEYLLISLKLFRFNNPLLPIGGIPIFQLIWGAGSGIVFIHFMKREFIKKVVLIIFFSILTMLFELISLSLGASTRLNGFNAVHNFLADIVGLAFVVWIAEGLWADKIYQYSTKPT